MIEFIVLIAALLQIIVLINDLLDKRKLRSQPKPKRKHK
ncbi:MAG: hypothetical protein ACI8WB_000322 [Phenylobacterium sp.]|jgi:hypothetical protein